MKCNLCEEIRGIQACHIIPRVCDRLFGYIDVEYNKLNRLYLCPNHHWYFDHNLLTPEEFKQLEEKIQLTVNRFYVLVECWQKLALEKDIETLSLEEQVKFYTDIVHKNKTLKGYVKVLMKENSDNPLKTLEVT